MFKKLDAALSKILRFTPFFNWLVFAAFLACIASTFCLIYLFIFKHQIPPNQEEEIQLKLDFKNLRLALIAKKETNNYRVSKIEDGSVNVESNVGEYFTVDLMNPVLKKVLLFDARKYSLNEEKEGTFKESLKKFQADVMTISEKFGAKIFILGSADFPQFKAADINDKISCGGEKFADNFRFHEKANNGSYQAKIVEYIFPTKYDNTLLPELRARYIQCKYKELFPSTRTSILQGSVSVDKEQNSELRKASLILFIPKDADAMAENTDLRKILSPLYIALLGVMLLGLIVFLLKIRKGN